MSKPTPARTSVVNPRRNSIADITHRFKDIYFHFKALMPPDAVGLVNLLVPLNMYPKALTCSNFKQFGTG